MSSLSQTASDTANNPNNVVNLITGLSATDEVSLNEIADRIAHDRRRVQRCVLHLELGLDDFLRIVPRTARVGHEDGLVETEKGDRDEVADEEERLHKRKGERGKEHGQENIEHSALRVDGANLDDLLTVLDRRPLTPSSLMFALMNSTAR